MVSGYSCQYSAFVGSWELFQYNERACQFQLRLYRRRYDAYRVFLSLKRDHPNVLQLSANTKARIYLWELRMPLLAMLCPKGMSQIMYFHTHVDSPLSNCYY
jgi:hypothetical protein